MDKKKRSAPKVTKPNRFERVVEEAIDGFQWNGSKRKFPVALKHISINLLRREHAWMERKVLQLRKQALARTQYQNARDRSHPTTAYTLACDDILHALERRGR